MVENYDNYAASVEGNAEVVMKKEPFARAWADKHFRVHWIEQKKTHDFYCRDYENNYFGYVFKDVIEDTSPRDEKGNLVCVRWTYYTFLEFAFCSLLIEPMPVPGSDPWN